ncbi:hypothetical protein [Bifidobacterium vansinderenii]|uniref:Uncharacterized protein n=1 Tax=Bifidobacterium vansinderenii TaxID=1984871 RepID=A0A229W1D0_9BIFI|nr:hypothetical protein [Bifidobacterium vansinderenii]OXN01636.1 hypothetical protein Tam10B_0078 [Bifidobacterium vansinderenii]
MTSIIAEEAKRLYQDQNLRRAYLRGAIRKPTDMELDQAAELLYTLMTNDDKGYREASEEIQHHWRYMAGSVIARAQCSCIDPAITYTETNE